MTFLRRCCLWCNRSTVFYFVRLILCPINYIDKLILVNGERAGNCYILCRHRCWYTAPSREGITFLSWHSFWCNLCTIFYLIGFILNPINHISQLILIDRKCSCYSDILSRHRLRNLAPSRERIASFCWCCFRRNDITLIVAGRLIHLAIYLIGESIYSRRYVGKCTCDSNILSRHRLWNITPT